MEKNRHMSNFLDITKLYLRDFNSSFTGREIARKLKVNHQTAQNHLKQMQKYKLLNVITEGRNNKYSLTLDKLKTKQLLTMAEEYKSFQSLSNFELSLFIEKALPLCETLVIFGSFAKKKNKSTSDIDVIAINCLRQKKLNEIKKLFPREIQIFYFSFTKFKELLSKKEPLMLEVKKDHLFYGNVYQMVDLYSQ